MKFLVKALTIVFCFAITITAQNAPTTWTPELQVKTRGVGTPRGWRILRGDCDGETENNGECLH